MKILMVSSGENLVGLVKFPEVSYIKHSEQGYHEMSG